MTNPKKGLCQRCEYRVRFLETGLAHRYECGHPQKINVGCCYMYRPVSPAVLVRRKGDKRSPFDAWLFAARMQMVDVADVKLCLGALGKNLVLWAKPKGIRPIERKP